MHTKEGFRFQNLRNTCFGEGTHYFWKKKEGPCQECPTTTSELVRNTNQTTAPKGYIAGLGRGAAGFTTRSDIGPASSRPSTSTDDDNADDPLGANSTIPSSYIISTTLPH